MDRYCNQDEAAFQPGRIVLNIKFPFGSSGAVPTTFAGYTVADGLDGTTPGSLAATGLYTFNLADAYVRLLDARMTVIQATYSASAGQTGYLVVDSSDSGTAPLVTFQLTQPGTGAAAAGVEGDICMVTLELQRMTGDQ